MTVYNLGKLYTSQTLSETRLIAFIAQVARVPCALSLSLSLLFIITAERSSAANDVIKITISLKLCYKHFIYRRNSSFNSVDYCKNNKQRLRKK